MFVGRWFHADSSSIFKDMKYCPQMKYAHTCVMLHHLL